VKNFKKFLEDAPTMSTGTGVAGTGDDSSTVVMRKKYDRKIKRKDMEKILKRMMGKDSA